MTPYRSPFAPPVAAVSLGRRHHLGATAPDPPSDAERWTFAGVNIVRQFANDAARFVNWLVAPAAPPGEVVPPAISTPAVGATVSGLGVGESAYSIATAGPNPQNVGGLTVSLLNLVDKGKAWLFGAPAETAAAAAGAAGEAGAAGGSAAGNVASIAGPAAAILGTGLTAYQVATNPTPGSAVGLATSATYTAGYAASAAGLSGVSAAASVFGPMFAAVSLPFILGSILDPIFKATGFTHRAAHFPGGYIDIPDSEGLGGGDGAAAVDPSTGRILIWSGKRYYWADQTQQGIPATPEQLARWGIQPTGRLATVPGYDQVPRFRDDAIMGKLQDQGTNMQNVRDDFITSWEMERRQPTIQAIKDANPHASEGEVWRQYTLTQEYQDEQAIHASLAYDAGLSDH